MKDFKLIQKTGQPMANSTLSRIKANIIRCLAEQHVNLKGYDTLGLGYMFSWAMTTEGQEFWEMADRLFDLEYIDEEMPVELKECPFCGNVAKMFPPDKDGNIISCKLGHAPMRTVEGWNTRN